MKTSVSYIALLASSVLFFIACSNIEENERLRVVNVVEKDTVPEVPTPEEPETDFFAETPRHILIEDYTGQNCVNCPNATVLIEQLVKKYDSETIVPVGIHSGPLGISPAKDPKGLATDLGETYYKHWGIEMQPMGIINRSDGALSTDWWTPKVSYDMDTPAPSINIFVEAVRSDNSPHLDISVTLAARDAVSGKLQLWLTEDSIVAPQKMLDGKTNLEYVHNHVLRCAVNGVWGEDISLTTGEKTTLTYAYEAEANWRTDQLAVVAFVYTDEAVLQVVRRIFGNH